MKELKGKILVDSVLYNPLFYVYNLDIEKGIGFLYDELRDKITTGEIVETESGRALKVINPDDKRKKEYYHLEYMFDINEKRWLCCSSPFY